MFALSNPLEDQPALLLAVIGGECRQRLLEGLAHPLKGFGVNLHIQIQGLAAGQVHYQIFRDGVSIVCRDLLSIVVELELRRSGGSALNGEGGGDLRAVRVGDLSLDGGLAQSGDGHQTVLIHHGHGLIQRAPGNDTRGVLRLHRHRKLNSACLFFSGTHIKGLAGYAAGTCDSKAGGIAQDRQLEGDDLAAAAGGDSHGAGRLGGDDALVIIRAGGSHCGQIRIAGEPIHGGIGALLGGDGGKEDVRKLLGIRTDGDGIGGLIQLQLGDLGTGELVHLHQLRIQNGLALQIAGSCIQHGAGLGGGGLADHSAGHIESCRKGIVTILTELLSHAGAIEAGGRILRPVKDDLVGDHMLLGLLPLQRGIGAAGLEEPVVFLHAVGEVVGLCRENSLGGSGQRLCLEIVLDVIPQIAERLDAALRGCIESVGAAGLADPHLCGNSRCHIAVHSAGVVNILNGVAIFQVAVLGYATVRQLEAGKLTVHGQVIAAYNTAHILGAGNIGRIIAVPHNGYIEPAGDAAHILCAVHRAHIGTGDDVCLTIGVVAGAIGRAHNTAHLVAGTGDLGIVDAAGYTTAHEADDAAHFRLAVHGALVGAVGYGVAIVSHVAGDTAYAVAAALNIAEVAAVHDDIAFITAANDAAHFAAGGFNGHIHRDILYLHIAAGIAHNAANGRAVAGVGGSDAALDGEVLDHGVLRQLTVAGLCAGHAEQAKAAGAASGGHIKVPDGLARTVEGSLEGIFVVMIADGDPVFAGAGHINVVSQATLDRILSCVHCVAEPKQLIGVVDEVIAILVLRGQGQLAIFLAASFALGLLHSRGGAAGVFIQVIKAAADRALMPVIIRIRLPAIIGMRRLVHSDIAVGADMPVSIAVAGPLGRIHFMRTGGQNVRLGTVGCHTVDGAGGGIGDGTLLSTVSPSHFVLDGKSLTQLTAALGAFDRGGAGVIRTGLGIQVPDVGYNGAVSMALCLLPGEHGGRAAILELFTQLLGQGGEVVLGNGGKLGCLVYDAAAIGDCADGIIAGVLVIEALFNGVGRHTAAEAYLSDQFAESRAAVIAGNAAVVIAAGHFQRIAIRLKIHPADNTTCIHRALDLTPVVTVNHAAISAGLKIRNDTGGLCTDDLAIVGALADLDHITDRAAILHNAGNLRIGVCALQSAIVLAVFHHRAFQRNAAHIAVFGLTIGNNIAVVHAVFEGSSLIASANAGDSAGLTGVDLQLGDHIFIFAALAHAAKGASPVAGRFDLALDREVAAASGGGEDDATVIPLRHIAAVLGSIINVINPVTITVKVAAPRIILTAGITAEFPVDGRADGNIGIIDGGHVDVIHQAEIQILLRLATYSIGAGGVIHQIGKLLEIVGVVNLKITVLRLG